MRNPRPCRWCGGSQVLHWWSSPCLRYEGVKRTEPLRAVRTGKTSGHFWHRRLDEMPDPTEPVPAVDLSTATIHLPKITNPYRYTGDVVPVEALRKFLDAEQQQVDSCEYGVYNQGRLSQIARTRAKFCD